MLYKYIVNVPWSVMNSFLDKGTAIFKRQRGEFKKMRCNELIDLRPSLFFNHNNVGHQRVL